MRTQTKLVIGIVTSLVLLAGLGVAARSGLRNFFYPVAPPMPAEVGESMIEILSGLEHVLHTNAPQVLAALQPGLTDAAIEKLENQNSIRLPAEIRATYRWRNGSSPATNGLCMDFIPIHRFLPLEEALAEKAQSSPQKAAFLQRLAYRVFAGHRGSWICLLSDGAGDGYWYDLKRAASQGAVFYNFTETGTFVFFPSAKNLMASIAKCYEQGVFRIKKGSNPPEVEEDSDKAEKIWAEFGASNQ